MTIPKPYMDRRSLLKGSVTVAGLAVALPSLTSLSGCSTAPPNIAPFKSLIETVSDRIIPQTDTGGALAAKVPEYIVAVFEKHFSDDQKHAFTSGLASLEDPQFLSASPQEQDDFLSEIASAPSDAPRRIIFQQLRDMTIFGFYTSETAKSELAFEELPGRYAGCVPLAEIGSAWLERGI